MAAKTQITLRIFLLFSTKNTIFEYMKSEEHKEIISMLSIISKNIRTMKTDILELRRDIASIKEDISDIKEWVPTENSRLAKAK